MRLWATLYGTIWIVFLEFLLSMAPQGRPWILYAHYGLGFVIVGIACVNSRALRQTTAPGRLKRIASATFSMSILMAVLGVLLVLGLGTGWPVFPGVTVWNLILLLHVATAFGIITQMAAVAIAHDMWEDKEFLQETRPGEVPRPSPARDLKTG
ncbi:MAG: hypothetical protein ACLQD8_03820 [Thermoplasmata archaeon]